MTALPPYKHLSVVHPCEFNLPLLHVPLLPLLSIPSCDINSRTNRFQNWQAGRESIFPQAASTALGEQQQASTPIHGISTASHSWSKPVLSASCSLSVYLCLSLTRHFYFHFSVVYNCIIFLQKTFPRPVLGETFRLVLASAFYALP